MAVETERESYLIAAMGEEEEEIALRKWVLVHIIRSKPGTGVPMVVSQELGLADSCTLNARQIILAAPYINCQIVRTDDGWWELCCDGRPAINKRYSCDDDVANHLINHIRRDYIRPPRPLALPSVNLTATTSVSPAAASSVASTANTAASKVIKDLVSAICRRAILAAARKAEDSLLPCNDHQKQQSELPSVGKRILLNSRFQTESTTTGCVFKIDEKAATVSVAFDDFSWECVACPDRKFPGSVLDDVESTAGVYYVLRSRLGQKLPEGYLSGPAADHFTPGKWKAYTSFTPAAPSPFHASPPFASVRNISLLRHCK
eukprot:6192832-Pleurochrysis_carterae.AAC.1